MSRPCGRARPVRPAFRLCARRFHPRDRPAPDDRDAGPRVRIPFLKGARSWLRPAPFPSHLCSCSFGHDQAGRRRERAGARQGVHCQHDRSRHATLRRRNLCPEDQPRIGAAIPKRAWRRRTDGNFAAVAAPGFDPKLPFTETAKELYTNVQHQSKTDPSNPRPLDGGSMIVSLIRYNVKLDAHILSVALQLASRRYRVTPPSV